MRLQFTRIHIHSHRMLFKSLCPRETIQYWNAEDNLVKIQLRQKLLSIWKIKKFLKKDWLNIFWSSSMNWVFIFSQEVGRVFYLWALPRGRSISPSIIGSQSHVRFFRTTLRLNSFQSYYELCSYRNDVVTRCSDRVTKSAMLRCCSTMSILIDWNWDWF